MYVYVCTYIYVYIYTINVTVMNVIFIRIIVQFFLMLLHFTAISNKRVYKKCL